MSWLGHCSVLIKFDNRFQRELEASFGREGAACAERRRPRSVPPSASSPHHAAGLRRSAAALQLTRVPPAKTFRPGSLKRRPADFVKRGKSSFAITRCRPFTAACAITRARTRATARTWTTAVSIHAVERFLGDEALAKGWTVQPRSPRRGKRVLVIGAGPSGLSTAWHLALLGHTVVIHEAGPMAGGMMHFGIPKYRLPREVLDAEIKRIEDLGVEIVLNHKVEDLLVEKTAGRFDAVFLAVGAHLSRRQDIPARDAGKIYDALQFLEGVESGRRRRRRSVAASRFTAAATPRWMPRARRAGSAPNRSSSIAARASRCPRMPSKRTRPSRRASRFTGCARSSRSTARRSPSR